MLIQKQREIVFITLVAVCLKFLDQKSLQLLLNCENLFVS